MQDLVHSLLKAQLSRRGFVAAMISAGYSSAAAQSALQSVSPFVPGAEPAAPLSRVVEGTGGDLMAEQLIEAGARFLFVGNGSGLGPLCDALVTRPQIQLIQAVHEGQLVAVADGYAKATGKPAFGMFSRVGMMNASSNIYNAYKDRTPVVLFSDHADSTYEGTNGEEDIDDWIDSVKPFTKWRWVVHEPVRIPEWVRNATKVATVVPGGPTYVRIPRNLFYKSGLRGTIFSGKAFEIPMEIHPDAHEVDRAARLLLEAKSPLIVVGHEVTQTRALGSLVKLADLLAIPAVSTRSHGMDFPSFHPLYAGVLNSKLRYPKDVDLVLNIGAESPLELNRSEGGRMIHATVDPQAIGRNTALSAALLGNLDLVARHLVEAVNSLATPQQIERRTAARRAECAAFTSGARQTRLALARQAEGEPVPWYRFLADLNDMADTDAVIVHEQGSDGPAMSFFSFAEDAKLKIGRTEGMALGWGVGAAAGVKLALANRQVISIQGDGGFLFGQSDALWTLSRYDIPVLVVVLNNRSYEATRWRVMARGSAAGKAGRDYISYLGNPDVEFTKIAEAYGIHGEEVRNTAQINDAIKRGFRALKDGRPYLLDVRTKNVGVGAEVSWYPKYSVAKERQRQV
jgi:benzoylformate decarboxylase